MPVDMTNAKEEAGSLCISFFIINSTINLTYSFAGRLPKSILLFLMLLRRKRVWIRSYIFFFAPVHALKIFFNQNRYYFSFSGIYFCFKPDQVSRGPFV